MPMSDTVEELPAHLGLWLHDNHRAEVVVGTMQYAGWAGYFNVSALEVPYPEEFENLSAVIVAAWPNGDVAVEAFGGHSMANVRWMQWDECFRYSPTPAEEDIVFTYDWEECKFCIGGMTVRSWKTLHKFLNKKLDNDPAFEGSAVWFYDQLIGNYYQWEL